MKAVLLALALSTDALIAPQRSFGGARRAAKSSAVTMSASKKILVLGGDGFCGWPTALHLSDKGHDARRRRPKNARKTKPRARARAAAVKPSRRR